MLIEPRFRWQSLGSVFDTIGFSVEPALGGSALVPGSAREVPPWLLARPVIQRIAMFLRHRRRGFVERHETRRSPRGQIDWTTWASAHLPRGAWTTFPCRFSEPDDDPDLIAAVRWTLARVEEDLGTLAWSPTSRRLLRQTADLMNEIGVGPTRRPASSWMLAAASEWVAAAVEAMTWVAEERGLGGAKALDQVWEAWVAAFSAELGRLLGMVASPFQSARRALHWHGPVHSMGALRPDVELRAADRIVWIDAKYKAHFEELSRRGWQGITEGVRDQHRADIHQALAYASLADVPVVESLLVYPDLRQSAQVPFTIATVTSGRRRVRVILLALPFGFHSPQQKERCLHTVRELLAA
jgi:hypothetical protein